MSRVPFGLHALVREAMTVAREHSHGGEGHLQARRAFDEVLTSSLMPASRSELLFTHATRTRTTRTALLKGT
jgi:hypothetical protein